MEKNIFNVNKKTTLKEEIREAIVSALESENSIKKEEKEDKEEKLITKTFEEVMDTPPLPVVIKDEEKKSFVPIKFTFSKDSAISRMVQIFSVQAPSKKEHRMQTFILEKLKKSNLNHTIDNLGNILVTKGTLSEGESYPCIVAHMDKVHDFKTGYKVNVGRLKKTQEKIIWAECWDPKTKKLTDCGGCGDDGGGIYVALEALRVNKIIKVVFFVEEEIGCQGSRAIDLEFFKDCGYIIQGDRRGNLDLILEYLGSDVVSKEFMEIWSIRRFTYCIIRTTYN